MSQRTIGHSHRIRYHISETRSSTSVRATMFSCMRGSYYLAHCGVLY